MASIEKCFVCDKSLLDGETVNVKERGLNTFRRLSLKRKDGKIIYLRQRDSVTIHETCRKKYGNEKYSAEYFYKESPPAAKKLRFTPGENTFDFKNNCFLCSERITAAFLKKQNKLKVALRDPVYEVRSLTLKKTVLKFARVRDDEWSRNIVGRLESINDLVAEEGRYHMSCMKKLSRATTTGLPRHRLPATDIDKAMAYIYSYLEQNDDECQFDLNDLVEQVQGDFRPSIKTIKARLLAKYGDDILIIQTANKSPIICFRNSGFKLLTDAWYNNKKANAKEERLRIVETAASIVLEDIRLQVYDTTTYPPSDRFLENIDNLVPETLAAFVEGVVLKKKRGSSIEKAQVKCKAIEHAIISATRPRSYLSPLQLGLAAFLYKKYGSKNLLNVLSSLGFCSTYTEASLLEKSCIMHREIVIAAEAFSQFIFDNADYNINTLDGFLTFHAMGGIQCVSPKTAMAPDQTFARLTTNPKADVIGKYGSVAIQTFQKRPKSGLQMVTIQSLDDINPISQVVLPTRTDMLWLYAKSYKLPDTPGWNGFMERATIERPFSTSQIICLPFVNAPPSDYDTVFTVIHSAVNKCKTLKQQTCLTTFDQPLYLKARDIISAENRHLDCSNVVVRLGGFHLLMSYLGSIGYIMSGSGLKELLQVIYAPNSVDKMMSGHAYARAVRGHLLVHRALGHIIMQTVEFTDEERLAMENILSNLDRSTIFAMDHQDLLQTITGKFGEALVKLESNGPTAKLWVQYFKMVTLVKQFIEAERMGNWQLHLETVQKMLPYFHASGHYNYAKSCHLYLQDMLTLQDKMPPDEYQQFTSNGYFTIRRSNKFWSGIWTDMTIEQTLMRMMKSSGGLTHGRGITDSVLTKWTLGMVYLHNICDEIEKFCGVFFECTEQHVDMRNSRIIRDDNDVEKMLPWLTQHPPFPDVDEIMSISSGVVGNQTINCFEAERIGKVGINNIIGKNFGDVVLRRKDKVLPLGAVNSSIRIDDKVVPVDPLLIFQRLCVAKQSNEELEQHLQYELAPYPLSLFSEAGMRKTAKSLLYKAFSPLTDIDFGTNKVYIIDGGYLLHRVVWSRNATFGSICTSYLDYVQRHYQSNAVVVFDGYPTSAEEKGTKSAERQRRSKKINTADVLFDESMTPTVAQTNLLSNDANKGRFISILKRKFEEAQFTVIQATEDADTLIINTAIEMSSSYEYTIVVGEDVDLIVLMTALCKSHDNVYLLKPGKGKTAQNIYSSQSLKGVEAVKDNILFLHAISGCDTTSAPFNQGKMKFLTTMEKHRELEAHIQVFKNEDATADEVANAGEKFLLALYGSKNKENIDLDKYRYQCFVKSVTKSKFNLASLPPTSAAARQHSLRTYHQVQQWYGCSKEAEEWGWKKTLTGITPVTTLKDPAPKELLLFLSCKCKTNCGRACGCRKAGLKCSMICGFCNGKTCENVTQVTLDESDEDDSDLLLDICLSPEEGEFDELKKNYVDPETDTNMYTVENVDINEPGPSGLCR